MVSLPLDYHYSTSSRNEDLAFFQMHPLSQWNFDLFHSYINKNIPRKVRTKPAVTRYVVCLNNILDDPKVPDNVKKQVRRLSKDPPAKKNTATNSNTTVYNIGTHSSATVIGEVIGGVEALSSLSGIKRQQGVKGKSSTVKKPKSDQNSSHSSEEPVAESLSTSLKDVSSSSSPTVSPPSITTQGNLDELEKAWMALRQDPDFLASAHKYRLEKQGILQCGLDLAVIPDVPEEVYDLILLAPPTAPSLPLDVFTDYIFSVMQSSTYGTYAGLDSMSDKSTFPSNYPKDVYTFISRILLLFSDSIHHRLNPCDLKESEAAYCHYAIWPLLNQVVNQLSPHVQCRFHVGETKLLAMTADKSSTYLADGTVYLQGSGLEILLLEVSGPYGKRDTARNAYDHIKGAFGLYTMIKAILSKYPNADPALLSQVRVLFLHASSRDDSIRLWQMTPTTSGQLLLFERLAKTSISLDPTDIGAMVNLMQFLWVIKFHCEKAIDGIKMLNHSHAKRTVSSCYHAFPPLVSHLHPTPIKPRKSETLSGVCDLDPESLLQ